MKRKVDWDKVQEFCDEKVRSWKDIRERFGVSNGSISHAVGSGKLFVSNRVNKNRGSLSFDPKEAQKLYDSGLSWKEVAEEIGTSETTITRSIRSGILKSRSRSESMKLYAKKNPRKHSEETKKKISEIRRKFLKENPDKVPYLLNHYSKGMSYPEKYFEKVFRNENINLIYHFRIGTYELDFADPIRKIDIEIDGEQHYCDKKIVESDKRRNKYLEDRGWIIYRVRWSNFMQLNKEDKKGIVQQIKDIIKGEGVDLETDLKLKNFFHEYEEKRKKKKRYKNVKRDCQICGEKNIKGIKYCSSCRKEKKRENYNKNSSCKLCNKKTTNNALRCRECYNVVSRKAERPTKEELEEMINSMSWTAIGRKYNVSDNAVRKWAKYYGITWKKKKKKSN